jgi:hypothetical protein
MGWNEILFGREVNGICCAGYISYSSFGGHNKKKGVHTDFFDNHTEAPKPYMDRISWRHYTFIIM